jgi:hypothetical protein
MKKEKEFSLSYGTDTDVRRYKTGYQYDAKRRRISLHIGLPKMDSVHTLSLTDFQDAKKPVSFLSFLFVYIFNCCKCIYNKE